MVKDVVIVGGGVIGCSIALKLAQAGLKVAVLERGRLGREASWAAAGMLSPQTESRGPGTFFDLCMKSRSIYPEFAVELREISGIDIEYRDEGALCVSLDGEDRSHLQQWSAWQREAGLALESMTPEAVRDLEPAITDLATEAVFVPGDHQVENRRLMDALGVSLEKVGVDVREGQGVDGLMVERGRVTGAVCGQERIEAGVIVVAAGCWSGPLLESAGVKAKIVPVRGQMVALKGGASAIRHVLHSSRCYVIPRLDGRILIGATVEYAGFQKGVTAGGIASLLATAIELAPALQACEIIETWSGLRPDTADHLPILGPCGLENLFLATGHFRNGILLAPLTAELMAKTVCSGQLAPELSPFGIERFKGSLDRSLAQSD